MWQHDGRANTWHFVPETFKLTPEAQVHYDRGVKALKDGGVYRDDVGQCWPAGMPMIMTRVWPIAMVQLPTVIYMISHFENSVRIIYLDGRPHTDPDIVVRTFNGESIGHWEGDTLVVDTTNFTAKTQFRGSGENLHVVERFTRVGPKTILYRFTVDDPTTWDRSWTGEYPWNATDEHIYEYACHEGNYSLGGMLRGARQREAEEKKQ
jgi:hypothetical protein